MQLCASVQVFMLRGTKSKVQFSSQAIHQFHCASSYLSHTFAERLVASSSPNQSDDVLMCASLLQRSSQHFRAVSLLERFPDAASSVRGKIVLAQSHAALGDWDSVKVDASASSFGLGLMLDNRLC
jgi:hypothetical protein